MQDSLPLIFPGILKKILDYFCWISALVDLNDVENAGPTSNKITNATIP